MSLKEIKHRKSKPRAKGRRTPTQRQRGKRGWPDYDERENIFYTPTETPYADALTIRSKPAAEKSVTYMREEYRRASGQYKGKEKVKPSQEWVDHIHKAMDNTGKRARMSQKRPNITPKENTEMGEVANVYEKALASDGFGNYYSEKRMGARSAPLGLGKKGAVLMKGTGKSKPKVGDSLVKFRSVKYTAKGTRIMAWTPFRLTFKGGKKKAQAKKKELAGAGLSVRVVREGNIHHVYAHAEGRGKWKYQPADRWFDLKIREAKGEKAKTTRYERERKDWQRARKTTHKTRAIAKTKHDRAKKFERLGASKYKIIKTDDGFKIVLKSSK